MYGLNTGGNVRAWLPPFISHFCGRAYMPPDFALYLFVESDFHLQIPYTLLRWRNEPCPYHLFCGFDNMIIIYGGKAWTLLFPYIILCSLWKGY